MSNVTETPVTTQTEASELLVQLRALVQKIRGFGFLGKGTRRKLTTSASLPDAFLLSVAVALDALPTLAAASRVTAEKLRDVVSFSDVFAPLARELKLLVRGIEDAVAGQRAEIGQEALRIYTVAKGFNRPSDREMFVPHITNMKTTLKRGRTKASTPPKSETPPAKPDVQTTKRAS